MITDRFKMIITASIMLAAFFCAFASASADEKFDGVDRNYVYVGRHDERDWFLDRYSIEIKRDKNSERGWEQKIFPIGENMPANSARSIEQKFFTDGELAYNSSHRKNQIDLIEDEGERSFIRRCFEVGYENAFGEKFVARQATTPGSVDDKIRIVKSNQSSKGDAIKMTNENLTEIVFILDRSGSMGGMEEDTIGGFNSMLEKQKALDGSAFLTTILFDNRMEMLHDRLPLEEVKPITREEYWVRGSTALLDAVGEAIKHIKTIHKYARDEDRPSKTIFCITTDGMENASTRYNYRDVKRLIEQQKELGWEFLFLGADIDSAAVADRMGIDRSRAANYRKDSRGSGLMYDAFAGAVTAMRESGAVDDDWKDEVEADERDRK